jgi:hypothetical protein
MSDTLAMTSLTPIEFFGKVIDQHDDPVPNAKVRGSAEIVKRWMNQEWDEHYTTTDANGFFQFLGLHGQSLVIVPFKEGYEFKSDTALFHYSPLYLGKERHYPNSSTPVVFTMWKQQGAEPLVHNEINRIGAPVDGTPIMFDLLKGRKTTVDGDLILTIERTPIHIQRGERFDWKATLEMPSGGLVKLEDAYANEAPMNGYETKIVIEMPSISPQWQSSVFRRFYFRSRGGTIYGRIAIDVTANYEPPPTGVTLEVFVNPSGSRNLEYDPIKQATAP